MTQVDPCRSENFTELYSNCLSYIDVDQKAPLWLALPMYGYLAPTVTAVTVLTNTFIVLVLRKKHLRCPTNAILLAMAVTELWTGISPLPWSLYYYTLGGYIEAAAYGLPQFWCEYYHYMAEIIPTISHTCAVWLTVFLAIQRYIHVVKGAKNQSTSLTSMKMTHFVICAICIASVFSQIPHLLAYNNRYQGTAYYTAEANGTYGFCVAQYAPWVELVGTHAFLNTYYWSLALLVHMLPCISLIVATVLLIRFIRHAERHRRMTLFRSDMEAHVTEIRNSIGTGRPTSCASRRRTSRNFHATTRMLIVVIGIFLFIEVPAAIVYTLHILFVNFPILSHQAINKAYKVINIIFICRNVAILTSYPVNFAVYCGMSKQFRLTVRQLFSRGHSRSKLTLKMLEATSGIPIHIRAAWTPANSRSGSRMNTPRTSFASPEPMAVKRHSLQPIRENSVEERKELSVNEYTVIL